MTDGRKKILFDLDDTILDFHSAERYAISITFRDLAIPVDESILRRYSEINLSCWQQLERGMMSREEVLVRRFEMLFSELGVTCSAVKARTRYEEMLGSVFFFVPGAPELLETLYPRYDLYLVSNGNADLQERRLDSAGIRQYFKDIFVSERIGANKPSKAFFDACFAAIPGFLREDALIVGDSLSSDIRGGINAGVRTCWFNPSRKQAGEDISPDYEIRELCELPALLEKIFEE